MNSSKSHIIQILLFFTLSFIASHVLCSNLFSNDFEAENYTQQFIDDKLNTRICKQFTSNDSNAALSLKQAVNITVACNRNIHKAVLNRLSDNYNLSVSEYKFMPNLNVSTRALYEETDNDIVKNTNKAFDVIPQFKILTPIGTIITLDWENKSYTPNQLQTFRNATRITLRQPLLKQSGYEYQTASIKNARDTNQLQILKLNDFIENEINKTILLYRQIIQNQKQLNIQQKTLDISKKLLDKTKTLIKAGRLADYERAQVESQVASQEVSLADAKINLKQSYLKLANQLGIDNTFKIMISDLQSNINKPIEINAKNKTSNTNNFNSFYTKALHNHINYQSLLTQQQNLQRDYYVAFNQSRWTLDLTASYQIEGIDNKYNKSIQNQFSFNDQRKFVGLEFNIPLDFNPARNKALLENKIKIKQLELDKKQLEQEIYSELQNQLYQQQTLWDKLQLSQKSVSIKQKNFEMAKKKYEAGRLSSFELVRIQDDVESAKVIENNNIIAYLNNDTQLDKLFKQTLSKWGVELDIS